MPHCLHSLILVQILIMQVYKRLKGFPSKGFRNEAM
jgi:hypothetical protein